MATCNFSALNGTIFAYAMAYEDDETKETVYPDDWNIANYLLYSGIKNWIFC